MADRNDRPTGRKLRPFPKSWFYMYVGLNWLSSASKGFTWKCDFKTYVSEQKLKFLIFSVFWPEMDLKWSKIIFLTYNWPFGPIFDLIWGYFRIFNFLKFGQNMPRMENFDFDSKNMSRILRFLELCQEFYLDFHLKPCFGPFI